MSTLTAVSAISDRVNAMEESATLAMAAKARELAAQGINVINLSVGEPDFATPQYIRKAAIDVLESGKFTGYSPVPGYPELKQAIIKKLKKDNNIDATPAHIVVSTGAKQSIANTILSLINPGDEVVILGPYWVSYADIVKFADGIPVVVSGDIDTDFVPPIEKVKAAINDKTKAIMYSSPSNPAGAVLSQEYLEQLADIVASYDNLYVLADEIYEYINFEPNYFSIGSIDKVKDRVITINGFSKGVAMTGWRLGYICAAPAIAKATEKIQGQVTSGTCSIAQRAAIAAYEDGANLLASTKEMRDAYLRRRDLIVGLLSNVAGLKVSSPKGAFYAFPDVSYYFGKTAPDGTLVSDADVLSLYLLADANVSTVSGGAFGAPKNLRLSFAASDDNIKEAVKRIEVSLAKLK